MLLKSGKRYRGILKSIDTTNELSTVLKNVKQLESIDGGHNANGSTTAEMSIKSEDLVEVFIAKLDLSQNANKAKKSSSAWKTDTDISGKAPIRERELQAWQAPADQQGMGLEDELTATRPTSSSKKWDQFAANEQLFGVKSQWDEDVYTHKLDTSAPDFAARQIEAAKLAKEIEQSASTNPHVLEERGLNVDDSGVTEEDKYSGVQRNPNAWLPPARRPVNLPARATQDPAIISSQLAKPGQASRGVPSATSAQPGDKESSNSSAKAPPPIESHIMAQFKQFASGERDRLAVKKAATFKKEKDGRLQDLMKFSKDFKLNTPVPEDLVPILAKDKAKQEAIVQKAASSIASSPTATKAEIPPPAVSGEKLTETLRARIDKVHANPSTQVAATPLTKDQSSKALKPSASEFKPFNPGASAFTPSFGAKPVMVSSPALSNTSTQPRQMSFNADAVPFFTKKLKPLEEREDILSMYNPFKTYRLEHPDSKLEIEPPYKTLPAWPSEEGAPSLSDPPRETARPKSDDAQSQSFSPQPSYGSSPQQMYGFQGVPQYYGKNQYMPPGQFAYSPGPQYMPPQYMYQQQMFQNQRGMQPQMVPVPYGQQFYGSPQQPYTGFRGGDNANNNSSPRPRQVTPQFQQRAPEVQKPSPRPPPMGGQNEDAPKES